MVDTTGILLIVVGLALLFVGATASSYAVGLLGLLVGGAIGYLVGPTLAGVLGVAAPIGIAAAALLGAFLGAVLTAMLLKVTVSAIAFVVGTYAGWTTLAAVFVSESSLLEIPVALGIGLVAAAVAFVLTRTMLILITSFVGAALASTAVTWADLAAAADGLDPDPLLFDVTGLVFLALLALGILSQFGLFKLGYTTRLLGLLPGVRPVRNRGE